LVVIVERSMSDGWLSNTYVVGDEAGRKRGSWSTPAVRSPPLLEFLHRGQLTLTHVLLTHHHHDHVAELDAVCGQFPDAPVLIHELERPEVPQATGDDGPGPDHPDGRAVDRARSTRPGTPPACCPLLVDGTDVFTGDTLFKGSVGGVRAPGHTTYADLKTSIMDKLLALAPSTRIHPGHTDPTTVADELEHNRFVRIWRGSRSRGERPVHGHGRAGDAHPARRRLRRRPQGLGPLAGRIPTTSCLARR